MYIYLYTYKCIYNTCIHTYISLCIFLHIHVYITHVYIYTYLSIYFYIYTYISGQLSIATFKNPSVAITICISSFRYTHVITCAKGNSGNEIWTLGNRWNWNSCTKLALSASWIHSLIAWSERASERNSVVLDSNPAQVNLLKLLLRILQRSVVNTIYIYTLGL